VRRDPLLARQPDPAYGPYRSAWHQPASISGFINLLKCCNEIYGHEIHNEISLHPEMHFIASKPASISGFALYKAGL
jgi:hypothetical protein